MIKRRFHFKAPLLFKIALMAVAVLGISPTQAETYYKWVDSNGVTHYGLNPPDTETAQRISVKSGASSDQQQAIDNLEAQRETRNQPKTASQSTDNEEILRKNEEIRQENCRIQQQNLGQLQANRRVKETDANGEIRFLDENEIAARVKEVQTYLDENCKNL